MILSWDKIYCGEEVTVGCDGECDKAFGRCSRPTASCGLREDDLEYLSDGELGVAARCPGTWEGADGKPRTPSECGNRWCVRQCERAEMVDRGQELVLPDFSKRRKL